MSRRASRLAAGAVLFFAATGGAACATANRPEGIVERWLVALNQGSAGRPGDYADPSVSERLVPGWRHQEPGTLDVVEVGRGAPNGTTYLVPFRVVTVGGDAFRGTATVLDGHVVDFGEQPSLPPFPSEGGAPIADASVWAWGIAMAIALALIAAAAAAMRLVGATGGMPRRSG